MYGKKFRIAVMMKAVNERFAVPRHANQKVEIGKITAREVLYFDIHVYITPEKFES